MAKTLQGKGYTVGFTDKEVTAWGGLSILKQMLDSMGFEQAFDGWGVPQSDSNRSYPSRQLFEQFMASIWCGASRFAHGEALRLDPTLSRLFGWEKTAEFKAITRLFNRFDMGTNEQTSRQQYRWIFSQLPEMKRVTLDVDSTALTRNGVQEGAVRGYNATKRGRSSHHPLLAFIEETRLVANFWLRPGNASASNNAVAFLDSTLGHLGDVKVGLLRGDSGFFGEPFFCALESRHIPYIIAARMTPPLQRLLYQVNDWVAITPGVELAEIHYSSPSWSRTRRVVVVRQSTRKRPLAPGKTLPLFADDPDIAHWRYGAFVTSLDLPALQVWRTYRGRADCENRIKELKQDFGLKSFNLEKFWATEAALNVAMLAYNLMSLFRYGVLKKRVQHTLSTLHGLIFAIPGTYHRSKNHLVLAIPRRKRAWFAGLWGNASDAPFNGQPRPDG